VRIYQLNSEPFAQFDMQLIGAAVRRGRPVVIHRPFGAVIR
jgi:hypothetical protein